MRSSVCVSRFVTAAIGMVVVSTIVAAGACLFAASALAATPAWRIFDESVGRTLPAGGSGYILLQVENMGNASTDGSPVTVTDRLPAGLTAIAADGIEYNPEGADIPGPGNWDCLGVGTSTVTCVNDPNGIAGSPVPTGFPVFKPTFYDGWGLDNAGEENPAAFHTMPPSIGIAVSVAGSASGALTNEATVSGGGAPAAASDQSTIDVGPGPTPFGVEDGRLYATNTDGSTDGQAGSHPYSETAILKFNVRRGPVPGPAGTGYGYGAAYLRGSHTELPEGLVGNPLASPRCSQKAFGELFSHLEPDCPADTQIGEATVNGVYGVGDYAEAQIYDLVPSRGEAALFGVDVSGFRIFFSVTVSSGPGHRIVLDSHDAEGSLPLGVANVDFWGVPSDPSNDDQRSGFLPGGVTQFMPASSDVPLRPLLTLPTECGQRQSISFTAEAWERQATFGSPVSGPVEASSSDARGNPILLGGCENLDFSPSIEVAPSSTMADSPVGVVVDVRSPQRAHEEDPGGLAEADLKNAVVSLPAGMTVNPAAANGLGACSEAQIELEGSGPGSCPASSKVGTVEVEAPALEHPLPGSIYLARQDENPFHSLLAGYIVVDDPVSGVVVKLAGELRTDPVTGQVTGVFKESPQFPLSSIKLKFFNELATPQSCGAFTGTSDLTPWSTPGTPDATPSSSFQIASGVGGSACPGGVLGFAPGFSAGTTSNQAGGFSSFHAVITRSDGEQHLSGVTVKMPPGLLGKLAGIPLCGEPQAGLGQCPAASQVGEASVAAGVGSEPFVVKGGRVYLTGPYNGGPFGLSIVVPGVAGPFDLGNVVERASIRIDPNTAQVSVVSDALPQMINSIEGLQSGIPADIRSLDISVNRPGFIFNPTSCEPLAVAGSLTGVQGTTVPVSSRFQAAGCQSLPFHPVFSVSTQAKTSKKEGASLLVKGTFPAGGANIHSVAVTLPKQLPARLTTIQQACPEGVFAANPASCPAGSDIGVVTATTPILANPVTGPAYLVSHGGAAFPDVVGILQGEGVTVDLTGSIDIKKGVTSSTFATVPDAPITSFQFDLPEGPHSGLAAVVPAKAKGSLCGQSLLMPFTITGQNGAQLQQNVKIAVTGCPKAKKAPKKKHKAKGTQKPKRKK